MRLTKKCIIIIIISSCCIIIVYIIIMADPIYREASGTVNSCCRGTSTANVRAQNIKTINKDNQFSQQQLTQIRVLKYSDTFNLTRLVGFT